jgi:hypothetical protein
MENWKERLLEVSFIYTGKDVGVIETITFDYDKLEDFISKELDKAREEVFTKEELEAISIAMETSELFIITEEIEDSVIKKVNKLLKQ